MGWTWNFICPAGDKTRAKISDGYRRLADLDLKYQGLSRNQIE
jgi:hypothetical protein